MEHIREYCCRSDYSLRAAFDIFKDKYSFLSIQKQSLRFRKEMGLVEKGQSARKRAEGA